jgi:DNA-binding CsgD family transcriptional regulator
MTVPSTKSIEEFFSLWQETKTHNSQNTNEAIENTVLDNYAMLNNQFINIYSLKQHKVLYMSNNFSEVLGYKCSREDYQKWAAYYWLRDLPFSQSTLFLKLSYLYKTKLDKILKESQGDINFYFNNFKLKINRAETKHLGLTCTTIDTKPDEGIDKVLIINSDVSPYLKDSDTWWMDLKISDLAYSYHSDSNSLKPKSILTPREMEILELAQKGFITKDIGEKLDISPATVEKHRKNLIEYTGAKDISSLLVILRLANMI